MLLHIFVAMQILIYLCVCPTSSPIAQLRIIMTTTIFFINLIYYEMLKTTTIIFINLIYYEMLKSFTAVKFVVLTIVM